MKYEKRQHLKAVWRIDTDFPDFERPKYSNIRKNIESNFKDFGLYKLVIDHNDTDKGIGDAVDDLTDIILDLWEIKWRIETNSLADGLWYF